MSAATAAVPVPDAAGEPRACTLLELVVALCEVTDDDREVVEAAGRLIRSGRVRLTGNFRGVYPDAFN